MKYFIFAAFLVPLQFAFATEARFVSDVNGKRIEFPIAKADGKVAWNQTEKSRLDVFASTASVSVVRANTEELAISTCIAKFDSRSDFLDSLTKTGLESKLISLKQQLDLAVDLGSSNEKSLKQRYNYLKEIYSTLP